MLLWGIDELLIYHYLIAESFRQFDLPYDKFWSLNKTQQADAIWQALFIDHSPISEACRGVLTALNTLGLDVKKRDLPALRQHFAQWKVGDFITRCLELANVRQICMTNSPFDDLERPVWERGFARDPRFVAALRIDPLLLDWPNTVPKLRAWGYEVNADFAGRTFDEVRRFLGDWTKKIDAQYCMVSLTPEFTFPAHSETAQLIQHAIMPHGQEYGQAFALMIGVKRNVNPRLRLAGDSVGKADIAAVENLCSEYPDNKFLCTMLSRENQHELCASPPRKFRNLHVFGCWWFSEQSVDHPRKSRGCGSNSSAMSMTPQHSDYRVLQTSSSINGSTRGGIIRERCWPKQMRGHSPPPAGNTTRRDRARRARSFRRCAGAAFLRG